MGDNGTDQKTPRQTVAGEVSGGKTDLNDAGTHIPLIVRKPGRIETGAVAEDLIDTADLFPTICQVVGVEIPADLALDGISFAGRLYNKKPSTRQWVTGGIGGNMSLFDGQWRVDTNSNRIIDARNLPREIAVEKAPKEFSANIERLRSATASLSAHPRDR